MNTSDIAIFVLSGRGNFHNRQAVRETWMAGQRNVLFLVGAQPCPIPPAGRKLHRGVESKKDRLLWTCDPDPGMVGKLTWQQQQQWNQEILREQEALRQEQAQHADLILVPMIDVYRNLPRKLKELYRFAVQHTNARWIAKMDDDQFLRVPQLTQMFRTLPSNEMQIFAGRCKSFAHVLLLSITGRLS